MEPYQQITLLIIIGIAFSIFVYYWGRQTGRMQMINELSGSNGDWDGRSARRKMFIALWDGIRSRYTEENLPTGLATFFREAIRSLLEIRISINSAPHRPSALSSEHLKSIINGEIDGLEEIKKPCPHYHLRAGSSHIPNLSLLNKETK